MVLTKGLVKKRNTESEEDISVFLVKSSMETKYAMYVLTGNLCVLGDYLSILRRNILPALCRDLDALMQQETPSKKYASW